MKKNKLPDNQIAFYQTSDGSVNVEVLYAEENIWLPQKRMAELFDTTPQNITQHLKNIYAEGELGEASTCKKSLQVQKEGSYGGPPLASCLPGESLHENLQGVIYREK